MNELESLLIKYVPEQIVGLAREAIERTQSTLRDGETLPLEPERVAGLGRNIEDVLRAIAEQDEITVYMARSEESFEIIQREGVLNTKAVNEIRGIGRYDRKPCGSLYFRFDPKSTRIAIMYKNGLILGEEKEKKHVIFSVSMRLRGEIGTDFLVVPSVSDPTGTNFIVRDVVDCDTRRILKVPYTESRFERVGEFLYTLKQALDAFQGLPIERIRNSFYRTEGRKKERQG